jgi:hypothetical protein
MLDGNPFATTDTIRFLLRKRLALPTEQNDNSLIESSNSYSHFNGDDHAVEQETALERAAYMSHSRLGVKYFYLYWDEDKSITDSITDPDQVSFKTDSDRLLAIRLRYFLKILYMIQLVLPWFANL